ncbi:YHS domain-containing (seleno)protein [Vibrio sp. 779(2023)]|uniref:YHS domain-containing (seleno)protein n=1 Tax=Vibrio sp. 779(2023) TaxID=3074712 RepID=UPI002965D90A|nr:YHS domain-containing (seleno)protein [Vibrio sp. 779(2023)]MDW3152704.1 YHS domain-containing (seleno)protein [Vibrio sp. 779(2023)]
MKYSVKIVWSVIIWVASVIPAFALEPVYSDFWGRAIKGYDSVSYFTDGIAAKGDSDFIYQWNGSKWLFSSQQNLELFVSNPEKYAPQYGGYCAWAVSKGYAANIDPNAWNVVEGKLYLNYSKSVQETWQKDIKGNVAKANVHWPNLISE